MSAGDGSAGKGEKTRLCPTCRMEISVLATKCRFCGESVGRPQEATRSLSINDLGGETVRHYAPSSNVMDALESFRAEETAALAPVDEKHEKSLFGLRGKKHDTDPKASKNNFGLPELDAKSQDLASVSMGGSAIRKSVKKGPPKWIGWVSLGAKCILALAAIYALIHFGVPIIKSFKKEVVKPVVHNNAIEYMEQNKPPLTILRAAREALNLDDSEANRKIMSDARERVKKAVNDLLGARKYNKKDHDVAVSIAHEAVGADAASPELSRLEAEALEEQRAYRLVFNGPTATDPKKASFTIVKGTTNETVSVAQGEAVDGRFEVNSFNDSSCRLTDTKRERQLQCALRGSPIG